MEHVALNSDQTLLRDTDPTSIAQELYLNTARLRAESIRDFLRTDILQMSVVLIDSGNYKQCQQCRYAKWNMYLNFENR